MIFGPTILPSSRRPAQEDLSRYVRHEYRDDNPCWLSADIPNGWCIKLADRGRQRRVPETDLYSTQKASRTAGCQCPVLNAVSGGKQTVDAATRGGGRASP